MTPKTKNDNKTKTIQKHDKKNKSTIKTSQQ